MRFNPFGVRIGLLCPPPRVRCATLGYGIQPLRGTDRLAVLRHPGCAARPWAMRFNPFGVRTGLLCPATQGALRDPGLWDSTPSGYGPACCAAPPRVRCATLGYGIQPVRGTDRLAVPRHPGCAARPWAMGFNPFGVRTGLLCCATQGALRDPGLWD